jgi:hypothetical protein
LDKNIYEMKDKLSIEKSLLNDIEYQMNNLKTKYEIKNLEINNLNAKIEEKSKVLNEAKKAYGKILEKTAQLIEAVELENQEK